MIDALLPSRIPVPSGSFGSPNPKLIANELKFKGLLDEEVPSYAL
jgi:hypothetical protein